MLTLTDKERQYIFGNSSEKNIYDIFSNNKNVISINQGDRYSKYDFIVITSKTILVIELKTRLFQKQKYQKTYFQSNKLDSIKNMRNSLKSQYDNRKFFFVCLIGFTKDDCNGIADIEFNDNNEIINMPEIEYHYIFYNKNKFKEYDTQMSYWRNTPQLTINIPIADISPLDNLINLINNNII